MRLLEGRHQLGVGPIRHVHEADVVVLSVEAPGGRLVRPLEVVRPHELGHRERVLHVVAELGLRVALGATPSDVGRLVLGEGLRLAGFGAAIGLAGAVAATRVLRGLLFDVAPLDPVSIVGAALLLVGAAALASYLPARQATRADPLAVLRTT